VIIVSAAVRDVTTGEFSSVTAAHYALMREYVEALIYVRNCEAAGTNAVGSNLVRSHVKQRIGELETAYIYRANSELPDSDEGKWYGSTVASLTALRETLPSHSAWWTIKGLASKLFGFALAVVGLVTVDRIAELELPKQLPNFVHSVTDSLGQDIVPLAGPAIVTAIVIPLQAYIWGFYAKRRVLLGNEDDVQILRRKAGSRPDGRNIYELEDDLFRTLGLVKRRETQRDKDFLWTIVALIAVFWWVPLLFDTPPEVWAFIAAFALVALTCAAFIHVRAAKRVFA
jgi:hypothetical protein